MSLFVPARRLLEKFVIPRFSSLTGRSAAITLFFGSLVATAGLAGVTSGVAQAEVCPPSLNTVPYAPNTQIQGSIPLSFYGGTMAFDAELNGSAAWSNGIQVQNQTVAPSVTADVIYLQPTTASNYLSGVNYVDYILTFPTPLSSLSLRGGGLNNFDGTTMLPSFGGTAIPVSAANFSNLDPAGVAGGPALGMYLIDSPFDADADADTVVGSSGAGGTNVDTNLFQFDINGPIDQLIVRSGKANGATGTVTIALHSIQACQPEIELVKSISSVTDNGDSIVGEGDTINYSFSVTNDSTVALTGVTVTDSIATMTGGPIETLAAGATDTATFTATHVITAADVAAGGVENTATASGAGPGGSTITDVSDAGTDPGGAPVGTPSTAETPSPLGTNPNSASDPGEDPTTFVIPLTAVDDEDLNNTVGDAVTVDVLGNDTPGLDAATVQIVTPGGPASTLDVPGEGAWSVNSTTGAITFTPLASFSGNPTPIDYTVSNASGATATATVTVTYVPVGAPVAADDEDLGNTIGDAVTVDVLANDSAGLLPSSVRIASPTGPVTSLEVPGEGAWSVNSTTGAITFTPLASFSGNPTPITYSAANEAGATATATVTVTYAPVVPPIATNDQNLGNTPGTAVTVNILANDGSGLLPSSVRIVSPSGPVTTLVVSGQGTWSVNPTTGAITFTPQAGFTGNPTPITYTAANAAGAAVTASVTITYITPSPNLPATGSSLAKVLLSAFALLATGGAMVLGGRRRSFRITR
jgi:uncharacterized repeat protein (TIGR01451 family)